MRGRAGFFRRFSDFLTMLIGAGIEKNFKTFDFLPASDDVGTDDFQSMTEMSFSVTYGRVVVM